MSEIHKRLYAAMKQELMLLSKCFVTYLPPQYPYDVVGGQKQIFKSDFDERVDIIPVADPNIFSQTQRISVAQTQLQLAMSNPKMHNLYVAYRDMYEALDIKDVDMLLPPPQPPQPKDPAMEHIDAMNGKPFKAFPGQDHEAHMEAHLSFMGTIMARNNPQIIAAMQKNIMEHISLMAQEQVQLEFVEEMQQLQQLSAQMQQMMSQAQQNPQMAQQMQQNPQVQMMQKQIQDIKNKIESRKAKLVAEITAEYLEEEKKVLDQMSNDPLIKLKADEVQIKAKKEQRETEEGEEKLNLDKMKMMQGQSQFDEKLEQEDEHQHLRAAVSLAKDGIKSMQATVKETKK